MNVARIGIICGKSGWILLVSLLDARVNGKESRGEVSCVV